MSGPEREEAALLLRCKKGEPDAIRELVETYQGRVFGLAFRIVANREDARDIAQTVFFRAIRALDRFDVEKPFKAWIFEIARRVAIDHLRRARVRGEAAPMTSLELIPPPEEIADPADLHDATVEKSRLAEQIARLVEHLPPDFRTILHLRHVEQMALEEIAQVLGAPLGTVKSRLSRAHERLRELYLQDRARQIAQAREAESPDRPAGTPRKGGES